MFLRLLVIFTIIPLIELYLLLKVGSLIGVFNTIALVILTAVTGAYLARRQGLETIAKIRQQLSLGTLPADELIDGVCILVASLLLVTPGLLTDAFGFSLLIPFTRIKLREYLKRVFHDRINSGGGIWIRRQ